MLAVREDRPLAEAGFTADWVGVAGGRLRLWHRPGEGRPIVLAHGLAQSAHFWTPLVTRLGGPPVWAVDQRGHGDSDLPLTSTFTMTAAGSDLAAVCRATGNRPLLVGHSWGAAATLQAGADHPDCAAGLVAIDGGLLTLGDVAPLDRMRRLLAPPDRVWTLVEFDQLMRRGPLGPWWSTETSAAVRAAFAPDATGALTSRLGRQRHLAIVEGMLGYDARDVTSRITVPVWAVSAEGRPEATGAVGDTYAQPAWRAARDAAFADIGQRAPGLRLIRITGAVHDLPLQWPDLVAGLLRTALAEAG